MAVRDFDAWFKSIDEGVLSSLWSLPAESSISVIEPMIGTVAGVAARKQMLGLFNAQTVQEARKNAREAYDAHHRRIREMVPEGMLLEYRMGEGWEPMCEFLGKPVPEGEFPWVNEAAELRRVIADKIKRNAKAAAAKWVPWIGAAAVVGFGAWVMARRVG
ncbi:hypothetical protein ACJ41O_001738 [Fusarium nematophilum]